jgi:hypothetical protein
MSAQERPSHAPTSTTPAPKELRRVSDIAWKMAQTYLEHVVRDHPAARGLWVTEDGAIVTLWVATEPIAIRTELELCQGTYVLVKTFPYAAHDLRILNPNPQLTKGDPMRILPPEAQLVWER